MKIGSVDPEKLLQAEHIAHGAPCWLTK